MSLITIEFEAPKVDGIGMEALRIARDAALGNMTAAVLVLVNSFKRVVGGTGRGRLYRRGKRGRVHQASAPGEPPARDFGNYVNSFDWQVHESTDEIEGRVGSSMWHTLGRLLEFGTRPMKPRPHVDLAVSNARDDIEKALAR